MVYCYAFTHLGTCGFYRIGINHFEWGENIAQLLPLLIKTTQQVNFGMKRLVSSEMGVSARQVVEDLAVDGNCSLESLLDAYGLEPNLRQVPRTVLSL